MGESERSTVGKVVRLKYEVNCGRNYLAKNERSIVGGTIWLKMTGHRAKNIRSIVDGVIWLKMTGQLWAEPYG